MISGIANPLNSISDMKLYWACTIFLMYINHSINFLLYCLGGKTFRHEFYHMIGYRFETVINDRLLEMKKMNAKPNSQHNKI